MIATSGEDITTDGFEVSVDEAAYLVEHLDLSGRLPEVLALYNPMTGPDLADSWKNLQRNRLTERGIITPAGVVPEVTRMMRTVADAEETLAIRIIPLRTPDIMLRVAIATLHDRFVTVSRTRDIVLAQLVPAADWPDAATAVLDAVLGTHAPAALSGAVQLTGADVRRISDNAPGQVTDLLLDYGLSTHDAEILNASSKPDVVTEITALRRVDGVTRRTKTAVSLLDTDKYGRVIAWPHVGPDHRTHITYAPPSPNRLASAIRALLASLDTV